MDLAIFAQSSLLNISRQISHEIAGRIFFQAFVWLETMGGFGILWPMLRIVFGNGRGPEEVFDAYITACLIHSLECNLAFKCARLICPLPAQSEFPGWFNTQSTDIFLGHFGMCLAS